MTRYRTAALCAMVACVPLALHAQDDACTAEIAAMFKDGPLDPFARPAHRQQVDVFAEDGSLLHTTDGIVVTPVRQISGFRGSGQFMLMDGERYWTGPTMEGPWTDTGAAMTEDMVTAQQTVPLSMAENLSETECPGAVETDDGERILYRFRTRVDPHPSRGESWWGAFNQVWLDPETRLPLRWELTEHVSSWHEGVKDELHVVMSEYDDTITLPDPG